MSRRCADAYYGFRSISSDCLRNQGFVRQAEPQAWYDAWCTMLAAGTAPAEIARVVLDAIRDEQFYIIPHPELLPLVRERMETILAATQSGAVARKRSRNVN